MNLVGGLVFPGGVQADHVVAERHGQKKGRQGFSIMGLSNLKNESTYVTNTSVWAKPSPEPYVLLPKLQHSPFFTIHHPIFLATSPSS
jgi:hypothetical protein